MQTKIILAIAFLLVVNGNYFKYPLLKGFRMAQAAAAPNNTKINMLNNDNAFYFVNITLNNQTFNMIVDTGYGWSWVTNISDQDFTTNNYNCSDSETCVDTLIPVTNVTYLTNNVTINGTFITDNVDIGALTLNHSLFILVTADNEALNLTGDGYLGLGMNASSLGIPTVLDRLYSEGLIDSRVFSIYLSNDPLGFDTESVLVFGDPETSFMDAESNLTYVPIVNDTFVMIDIEDARVGTTVIANAATTAWLVTSVPYIVIPSRANASLTTAITKINANCNWLDYGAYDILQCACTRRAQSTAFPALNFTINGTNFVVNATDYVTFDSTNQVCNVWLAGLAGNDQWIFGAPFFRAVYTVFDYDNNTVGLAPVSTAITLTSNAESFYYPNGYNYSANGYPFSTAGANAGPSR